MTKLLTPAYNEICSLQTETQKQFIREHDSLSWETFDWRALENSGSPDRSLPRSVILQWETDQPVSFLQVTMDQTVLISQELTENTYILENLIPGIIYEWTVNGQRSRFITEDAFPRWIHAEGASNIRDMGGLRTLDGHRIRYGRLYRGTEMDTHHSITEEGLHVLNDVLHIRTDLDLRGEAVDKVFSSPMGDTVDFQLIPILAYDELTKTAKETQAMKRIFDLLADENSYPIYYHCWGGADRTGCLAFILEAFLGVDLEDRLLDYELTSLSIWGVRSRNGNGMQEMLKALRNYGEDPTYRTQAIAYLKDCGITDATLNAVKKNLLDLQ